MNDLSQDDGLIQDFLTESDDLLQTLEQDLLSLDANASPDLLNRIFRAMHTIKGTSSFLGFDQLVTVAHRAEDLLNALRRNELPVYRELTDVLLSACDVVKTLLDDVRNHRTQEHDLTRILEAIARVSQTASQAGSQPAANSQPSSASQPESAPAVAQPETSTASPAPEPSQSKPAPASQPQSASVVSSTMRVDVRKLDFLVNLVGELVLERNRLLQISKDLATKAAPIDDIEVALAQSTSRLNFITDELQASSLSTRMVPLETVFKKLPRMVRDLAQNLSKEVEVKITGAETEIDKTMIEQLGDPLVHIIRNSLDHGIESPDVRAAAGKPRTGLISVSAAQEGEQIVVVISDDGRGIDPDRIGAKAVQKGLITPEQARTLSRRDVLDLIFLPGFSTAENVSNVSGRGVGMDVVRTNLKRINGTVDLDSKPGEGTTIQLRVPLTMAILPVLMVAASGEAYAVPLRSVVEIVRIEDHDLHLVENREVLSLRDCTVPVIRLESAVAIGNASSKRGARKAVILSVGELRVALVVDQLLGQEATVIKPLSTFLKDAPNVAGATISGDGSVRLVLDPVALVQNSTFTPGFVN